MQDCVPESIKHIQLLFHHFTCDHKRPEDLDEADKLSYKTKSNDIGAS